MQAITFTMVGSERSGHYRGVAVDLVQVGIRHIGGSQYRLRVEPSTSEHAVQLTPFFTRTNGWKQPGDNGQNRFSKCVSEDELRDTLKATLTATMSEGRVHDDSKAPELMRELLIGIAVEKKGSLSQTSEKSGTGVQTMTTLLAIGRTLGISGLSPRWKPETIRRRIAEAIDTTDGAGDELTRIARGEGIVGINSRWKIETLLDRVVAARS